MVNVQLQESVAAALVAQASVRGLSLEEYLAGLVRSDEVAAPPALSAEEVQRQFESLSLDVPPLPADFSRADIYLDHD